MVKVVYNDCFGGFNLSEEAVELGKKLSNDPKWGYSYWDMDRTDPILVTVVEQLDKKSNGHFSNLRIADIPTGERYRIDEYDGNERVMTIDDYDWQCA